jgi:hypothetical protein
MLFRGIIAVVLVNMRKAGMVYAKKNAYYEV